MKNLFTFVAACLLLSSTLILYSCGGKSENFTSNQEITPLSCVVILPVQIHEGDTAGLETLDNLQAGAEFLDLTMKKELEKSKVSKIIESDQLQPPITEISGGKIGTIKEIGVRAQCDSVLVTSLNTYRQRQGGSYAVDAPASVAFEMQLFEASTGRGLWGATFSETQTSLMSNLFSFGKAVSRGFKWVTVEQLAEQGMQEKIIECPYFY